MIQARGFHVMMIIYTTHFFYTPHHRHIAPRPSVILDCSTSRPYIFFIFRF